jgi:predicted Zn-dependent protease
VHQAMKQIMNQTPIAVAATEPAQMRARLSVNMGRGRRAITLASVVSLAATLVLPSAASAQGLPLIRDTEIETLLRDYARPIFKVAGLGANNVSMRIIRHDSFNAFVADGRNVFMNSGALTIANTPNEVIGVIAHETGHITGGHLAALRARVARDQTKALLISILGIGAMIAGATSKDSSTREVGAAGQGVMMGGNELLMRSLLGERRSQEAAADQAGLKYLLATQQSGQGMLATFERFAQQEYISDKYADPFVRSHPVASDRLAQLRDRVAKSQYANAKDPPELQLRHDMMRAKLSGYLDRPQAVANKYPASDMSLPARYARAIARNCSGKCTQSLGDVDALIKEQPNNPYFWELKGNLQYWAGQHRDSIVSMRKALQLIGGNAPLMQVDLAQAMLGTEDASLLDEAIGLLRRANVADEDNSTGHHQLAKALYRKGQLPQADLATAYAHFVEGNVKQAQIFAKRAQPKLRQGTPEWLRAEDIITFKEPT